MASDAPCGIRESVWVGVRGHGEPALKETRLRVRFQYARARGMRGVEGIRAAGYRHRRCGARGLGECACEKGEAQQWKVVEAHWIRCGVDLSEEEEERAGGGEYYWRERLGLW